MLITVINYSQITKQGIVISNIPLNDSQYSIIQESESGRYYKTSPHNSGELPPNELVGLVFEDEETSSAEVVSELLTSSLFCSLIEQDVPQPENLTLPTLVGDILFFESKDHLQQCYESVQEYLNTYNEDSNILLNEIENTYPGFVSFRTKFNNDNDWINGSFSEDELTAIYEKDFVNDEIEKTFLNFHREIGIGNEVYYWHELNLAISADANDPAQLDILREIPEGITIDAIGLYAESLAIHDPNLRQNKGVVEISSERQYETNHALINSSCDPLSRTYKGTVAICNFTGSSANNGWACSNFNGFNDNPYYETTIDWGDGTTETDGVYHSFKELTHSYSTFGTYMVTITITFLDEDGNSQTTTDEIIIEVDDTTCTHESSAKFDQKVSGNWRLSSKLWVSSGLIFEKKIGSYSHAWVLNNGSWVRQKAKLHTSVNGDFRNYECEFVENVQKFKSRNKRKMISTVKLRNNVRYSIANDDCTSYHSLTIGNYFIEFSIHLEPCP